MPTENRSTMVSVPRELLERCCMRPRLETRAVNHQDIIDHGRAQAELREILAQPAQHQGELLNDARVKAEELQWAAERKLAERDALLLRALGAIAEVGRQDHLIDYTMVSVVKREIDAALSASAEPEVKS